MAIVCIAREYGALAEECSVALAAAMGADLLTREAIAAELQAAGVGAASLDKYDERKPGFLDSLLEQRDAYLHFLKSVLYGRAAKGPCVIVGRGGVPLFARVPSALMVRFIAPLETRVERIAAHFGVDPKKARREVERHDGDRRGFSRYFFGADWDDPSAYDLVVNTGKVALDDCAKLIEQACALTIGPEREAGGRRALEGLVLAQAVATRILYAEKLQVHFLEATCADGLCVLSGIASAAATVERAAAAAKAVPGVVQLRCEIQLVREYAVLP